MESTLSPSSHGMDADWLWREGEMKQLNKWSLLSISQSALSHPYEEEQGACQERSLTRLMKFQSLKEMRASNNNSCMESKCHSNNYWARECLFSSNNTMRYLVSLLLMYLFRSLHKPFETKRQLLSLLLETAVTRWKHIIFKLLSSAYQARVRTHTHTNGC